MPGRIEAGHVYVPYPGFTNLSVCMQADMRYKD